MPVDRKEEIRRLENVLQFWRDIQIPSADREALEEAIEALKNRSPRDIADHDRVFEVMFDKNVVGVEAEFETVEVPAGEDAEKICRSVFDDMMANATYGGWGEKE